MKTPAGWRVLQIVGTVLVTSMLIGCSVPASSLKPFTTDGCSGFPEGTRKHRNLWAHCCLNHDIAYWRGGTFSERLAADRALHSCVRKTGQPLIADLMIAAVRTGGTPYVPTRFRWGYGWPKIQGYRRLTDEQQNRANELLRKAGLDYLGTCEGIKSSTDSTSGLIRTQTDSVTPQLRPH